MNFFDIAYEMLRGIGNKPGGVKYEVYESQSSNDSAKTPEPQNILSIYTSAKILSSSLSQMSINVTKDGDAYALPIVYNLKYRMNDIQNNQTFWSTLEYHRNTYGNAFVDIRKGKNTIIHPTLVTDYDFKGYKNGLRFKISWSNDNVDKYNITKKDEWINARNLLHFKGMSVDGVFGLPPVSAAAQAMKIMDKASNTVVSFYDNRALSPMSLESTINTAAGAKTTLEALNTFNSKYAGTYNAGRVLQLPPNTKLTPLAIQFRDAELVATMQFTKDEIYTMYGIPTFMYSASYKVESDIEQQSLNFKTFTLSPITRIYEEELMNKLLTKEERMNGVSLEFNMDSLLEADLNTKAMAYSEMVKSGIMTVNEATDALGLKNVMGAAGDYHFVQAQYIALEDFDKKASLEKDTPVIDKDLVKPEIKKEDE